MRHLGAVAIVSCLGCLALAGQTVIRPFQASPAARRSQPMGDRSAIFTSWPEGSEA